MEEKGGLLLKDKCCAEHDELHLGWLSKQLARCALHWLGCTALPLLAHLQRIMGGEGGHAGCYWQGKVLRCA